MVNWTTFENLPGSVTYNFEMLCRSLIWLTYSRYGSFKALPNQPGVEFDLKVNEECTLGDKGVHFGWQCKWYELAKGVKIGKTRQDKIKEALEKTISTIPELTDWVLWTRHPLSKSDQEWFYGLDNKVRLHLWTCHEAETLLNGDGEQLKQTYFGNLIITPNQLSHQHQQSVAPIRKRWFPEVHQVVETERSLQRMLGSSFAWDELIIVSKKLIDLHSAMQLRLASVPEPMKALTSQFLVCLELFASRLKMAFDLIESGDFVLLHQIVTKELKKHIQEVSSLPRKLRGARLQIGLIATNALAELREGDLQLTEISRFLDTRLVGVVADAGGGKTQLAATLTAPQGNRPAGLLLLGRFLHHNNSLDDLARNIVINGNPVASMQALLSALNAAAERARCILPLVIDGLNEAEDPRAWKTLLSSLNYILKQYPSVLVICTLRSGAKKKRDRDQGFYGDQHRSPQPFVQHCLPDDTVTFQMPDFGDDVSDAIEKYFSFFKIDTQQDLLYSDFLRHPLTLRIFCEVTNPTRDKVVGMEAVPRSLAALFERYIDLAANRIEELSPYHSRYYHADIVKHLDKFGQLLWTSRSRGINERDFRVEIGDERNKWNNSAINFMEQEGLLLRIPGKLSDQDEIVPTYDLLGGFLIAKYIISKRGSDTIAAWLKDKAVSKALGLDFSSRHPLRDDIIRFLAALLPKYHSIQLWQVVDNSLRSEALEQSILLEGKYMDRATTELIASDIKKSQPRASKYFHRFFAIRATEKHPLNAVFVDQVLFELKVGKRDLLWTEWLRRNESHFLSDLDIAIKRWSTDIGNRTNQDFLLARWLMWMLTSTNHLLRHKVTLALYWFGRGDAENLFNLTLRAITINDPYVLERMLSASYGVSMALATESNNTRFIELLPVFARQIYEDLLGAKAVNPSTHILILDYARGIIELAQCHNCLFFMEKELEEINTVSKRVRKPKAVKDFDKQVERGQSPFRMDFENYIIGRLAEGRHNYDYNHKGYQTIRAQILWRVFDLGWSFKSFEDIERAIEGGRNSYNRHDDTINKTDRYGKKYSWIAYFEQKGLLDKIQDDEDDVFSDLRESYADLDPSFPTPNNEKRIVDMDTLGSPEIELQEWIKNGKIPDLSGYLCQNVLELNPGPWILLDGHIGQQDERKGRSMFGFFRSFFVPKDQEAELVSLLKKQRLGGRWLPEKAEISGAFAGEIPWSSHFREGKQEVLTFVVSETTIDVLENQDKIYVNGIGLELSFLDQLRLSGISFPKDSEDVGSELSDEDFNNIEVRNEQVMVQRTLLEKKEFSVIQPVCDLRSLGKTQFDSFTGGSTLNKRLCQMLDLIVIPQSRDLQTRLGERATFQNGYEKNSFKNSERLFFLRKDLLDELLEKLGMSLIWAVWGERELSLGQFEIWDHKNSGENLAYADFQQIHVYSPKQKR